MRKCNPRLNFGTEPLCIFSQSSKLISALISAVKFSIYIKHVLGNELVLLHSWRVCILLVFDKGAHSGPSSKVVLSLLVYIDHAARVPFLSA
jgi:hypothetical protein